MFFIPRGRPRRHFRWQPITATGARDSRHAIWIVAMVGSANFWQKVVQLGAGDLGVIGRRSKTDKN